MAYKRSRAAFEADLQAQQSPYAFYGTPLPPLDPEIRDDGSYVPIWKQEVTDERGRKRLHGAFTGGFSAGYFNTVGSKEGWTPSSFVSSRTNRAKDGKKTTQQRPEDFMDEEDLREAEEARQLQTNETFSGLGSTEHDQNRIGSLMDLFRTRGETMGSKLLRKMGWREGQGVGPRVRRKARLDGSQEDQNGKVHLFAPENPSMIAFTRKNDHKGLGYEDEGKLADSTFTSAPVSKGSDNDDEDLFTMRSSKIKKKKKDVRKGGFGVGILNDNGSDDEDPYSMGPSISYNKTIGGDKKKKKKHDDGRSAISVSNPLLKNRPVFISKKAASTKGFRKCHDGRLPLDGFVLSTDTGSISSIVNQDGKYPPPKIPKDWKSSKTSTSSRDASHYMSTADAARASNMDPKSRAALLGESQLPGKSVFDFLSPEARDRLAKVSGKGNLPAGLGEAPPKGYELTEEQKQEELRRLVPHVDKEVAAQALGRGVGGWMPYAEDESKRARYRFFLEGQAGFRQELPERAPGASKDDWAKELSEFAHAAQIFKPMTGMMASRFTTSSSLPKSTSDVPDNKASGQLLNRPTEKPEDPAEAAAKVGMYGPMTRSVQQFYPTRLLCKRFNVKPPPHVQMDPGEHPGTGGGLHGSSDRFQSGGFQTQSSTLPHAKLELVSKEAIEELIRESSGVDANPSNSGHNEVTRTEQAKEVAVDPERNEALEAEKPGEAVFKAIFGSDDEDEDEDGNDEG
ncbi:MAG: hypothetical protein M1834_001978 [Cirrosporium novae-zelandiae]|nr:MAG: hypothetical protein M1834_001978 [Cirrosporium novae-zelandiae]